MFADTEAIRGLALRMRRLADELRSEADTVMRAAGTVEWSGASADALRFTVRSQARALRRGAGLHDLAAEALLAHAAEVDHRLAALGSLGSLVSHLADAA